MASVKDENMALHLTDKEALRMVIDEASFPFIAIDEESRIVEWNRQAEIQLGWHKDEVLGKKMPEIIMPARFRDLHYRGIKRFLETRKGPMLRRRVQVPILKRNGEEAPYEMLINPICNANGCLFWSYLSDISESKLSEKLTDTRLRVIQILTEAQSIQEGTEKTIQYIGETMGWDIGCYWEKDGLEPLLRNTFTWCLPGTVQSMEEFRKETQRWRYHKGNGVPGLVWESETSMTEEFQGEDSKIEIDTDPRLLAGLRTGLSSVIAFPVGRHKNFVGVIEYFKSGRINGHSAVLELMLEIGDLLSQFILKNLAEQRFLELYHDLERQVADRTRALELAREKAEQANLAKSQFLANMSHEIRTPLTAVLGFAELLEDPEASQRERAQWGQKINSSGTRLLKIIDEILDLSKVEAGKASAEFAEVEVPAIASELEASLGRQAKERGLDFKVSVEGVIPRRIRTDQTRLHQILGNIIGNAIKFTDRGHVYIVIKMTTPEKMAFHITDTGIGISKAEAKRLFRPFMQIDSTYTRRHGGVGLGLALSRSLVRLLGGDIELLHSEPGKGSTFVVTIDIGTVNQQELISDLKGTTEKSASHRKEAYRLDGVKVLLVEDSIDNQILLKRFLSGAGAKVEVASNGQEGMDKALHQDFELVLMDIQMPVLDGLSATRGLRSAGYTKPILALTAHAMAEERLRSLHAGFTDHITKPIKKDDLLAQIAHHLHLDQVDHHAGGVH